MAIDLIKGTWFDHEAGEDGGVLDLLRLRRGLINGADMAWLEERGHLAPREQAKPGRRPEAPMVTPDFDILARAMAPEFSARHAHADRQRDAAPDVEVVALIGFTVEDGETSRVIQAGDRLTMNELDVDRVHAGRVRRGLCHSRPVKPAYVTRTGPVTRPSEKSSPTWPSLAVRPLRLRSASSGTRARSATTGS